MGEANTDNNNNKKRNVLYNFNYCARERGGKEFEIPVQQYQSDTILLQLISNHNPLVFFQF